MSRPFVSFPFSAPASAWRLAFIIVAVLAALMATIWLAGRPHIAAGFDGRPMTASYQERWTGGAAAAPLRSIPGAVPVSYGVTEREQPSLPALRHQGMLIRTGSMQLRVESLAVAVARAESVTARLGAVIATSSASGAAGTLHGAMLTIRVPSDSWDRLVGGIARLSSVERLSTAAEDVGEEYVDVEARIANGRRLEARLITLLATRTGKLDDVLAAERELARVREGLETLEGRRRYLEQNVALSTLRIDFVTGAVAAGIGRAGMFREAAGQAWGSFLWLVAFTIRVSGIVLPLALLAGLGWAVYRRFFHTEESKVLPIRQLNVS
jgi:hypothetical protein